LLCEGYSQLLGVDFNNPPYLWSTGETTQSIIIAEPGLYWINSGAGDCFTSDSVYLTSAPTPEIDLGPDTLICKDDTLRLSAGDSTYRYLWSTHATTSSIVVSNPPQHVWVEAYLGTCMALDDKIIELDPCLCIYVPNAFSPNGDDSNDGFKVIHCPLDEYLINVYNRWGEKLYTSTDPDASWDGTYDGVQQPVGVYVYYIQAKEHEGWSKFLEGNVTLLR